LASLSLAEIVGTLLSSPVLDARIGAVFPLELTATTAGSLVLHACRQAARGQLRVHVGETGALSFERIIRDIVGSDRLVSHAIRRVPGCEDIEIVVALADTGTWCLCGKLEGDRFHAVHSADPLLATVLAERLERIAQRSMNPPPKTES
jgi:hypothetical protein